jgi:predicted Rossmann-fold nucleotide-binding protein
LANPFVEKLYMHRTFFTRLHHFVRLSHAFIVMEGGIGTTLEAFMVWQLCQVRHVYDTPLVFLGEMWGELRSWTRRYMLDGQDSRFAGPADLDIPTCVASVDEAVAVIRDHKRRLQIEVEK